MPQTPVNRYLHYDSPQDLHLKGPILDVDTFLPEKVAKLRGANPIYHTRALIDTGASLTCISVGIANALRLQPIHQIHLPVCMGRNYQTYMQLILLSRAAEL